MVRFFTIDRANARILEVRELLLLLKSQRDELVQLRDRYVELTGGIGVDTGGAKAIGRRSAAKSTPGIDTGTGAGPTLTDHQEARRIRLRIKGVVDQMSASVARIDDWGITLRDIGSGLIDFPALVNGRQVWLCWRLGEDGIEWWHELDAGFGGRRSIADLE